MTTKDPILNEYIRGLEKAVDDRRVAASEQTLRRMIREIVDRVRTTRNFVVHDDGTLDEIERMARSVGC